MITELCSNCDTEVEIKHGCVKQQCPNCNKNILPCSMCDHNEIDCNDCVFKEELETCDHCMHEINRCGCAKEQTI